MAEMLGLIASVVQLAGAGLKLSQTLYQYADGVATADRRIRDIAKEVQLTSYVIEELGIIFKQDESSSLISKNALKTADETMKECSSVFAEIDATLKKSKKNTLGRLMLPFRDNKIELLRNHIDKLKSTLQLLMQVLTHAHQVASKKLDQETEARQREQIKELLELKKKSAERYNQSLKDYGMSESSTMVGLEDMDDEGKDSVDDDHTTVGALALESKIHLGSLETCVRHIHDLLGDIEALQQALTQQIDGNDFSAHHQNLLGSYFRARGHLDAVLLGNPHVSKESLVGDAVQEKSPRDTIATGASHSEATQLETHVQSSVDPGQSISANQSSIKFQDTMGRKYVLPFHLYRTWKDIHNFVIQIYTPLEEWRQYASEGSFDLVNADGEIIMPAHWNFVIQPGSSVTLQFWQSCKQEQPISSVVPITRSDLSSKSAAGVDVVDAEVGKAQPSKTEDMPLKPPEKHEDPNNDLELSLGKVRPAPKDQKHALLEIEARQRRQVEIDATIAIMHENINKASVRGERLDSLQPKTDNLAVSGYAFRRKQQSPGLFGGAFNWFNAPSNQTKSTSNKSWGLNFGFGHQPELNPEQPPSPHLVDDDAPFVMMPARKSWNPGVYGSALSTPMSTEDSNQEQTAVTNEEKETEEKEKEGTSTVSNANDEVDELLKEWTNVLE